MQARSKLAGSATTKAHLPSVLAPATHPCCAHAGSAASRLQQSAVAPAHADAAMASTRRGTFGTTSTSNAPRTVSCQAAAGAQDQPQKLTVAITGATGLVGSRLTSRLVSRGHKVRVLTRDPSSAKAKLPYPGVEVFGKQQWAAAIQGADAVVNLAGEPIATRWTPEHKSAIKTSRVNTTKAVVDAIAAAPAAQRPKVLVSASAVGYYGNSYTASYVEDSPAGSDYLAEICKEWESAAQAADQLGVRTAILRIGIVLASDGGALGKMLPVFQIFAGGPLGSGRQWMSWIHRDDLVSLIVEAIQNPSYTGVFNATAPKPIRMGELCTALGTLMGRPSWLPVPDFALQTLLGEGASVVLEGQCVLPARTQAQGFTFKYQDVNTALRNILRS